MSRIFADLSNNNAGTPDFRTYRRKGGHVLIGLKATEGLTFVDDTHARRADSAHANRVPVIHYHFGHSNESAAGQAAHFWAQVEPHFKRKDYVCLDIEVTDGMPAAHIRQWIRDFDERLHEISGHACVGYSDQGFLQMLGPGAQIRSKRWWVAAFGPHEASVSWIKRNWAWQYSNGVIGPQPHLARGIGRNSDMSILNRASSIWLRRP